MDFMGAVRHIHTHGSIMTRTHALEKAEKGSRASFADAVEGFARVGAAPVLSGELVEWLSIMVIVGQFPANIVHNPGFMYLCTCVGIKQLPSRQTVERYIKEFGDKLKHEETMKVQKLLVSTPMEVAGMKFGMKPLISCFADNWSGQTDSFIGFGTAVPSFLKEIMPGEVLQVTTLRAAYIMLAFEHFVIDPSRDQAHKAVFYREKCVARVRARVGTSFTVHY